MKRLNYIVLFLLIVSACIAQKNADSKFIAKKKIKEIKAVKMFNNDPYYKYIPNFKDSVFITLSYDKKGRLLEYKDSLKRFIQDDSLTFTSIRQFDTIGDEYFRLTTDFNPKKDKISDTSSIIIHQGGYFGIGYIYNFSKSKDPESRKTEIDFYAYSKNQKGYIAFPTFYNNKFSYLVNGAEYVDYNAEIFRKNQIDDNESGILRNDTIYEIQGNYGDSFIRAINCIEKTDSGFIARMYDYINDSLVYNNTISFKYKIGCPNDFDCKFYKFIPDTEPIKKKVARNSNLNLINDKSMKGHFKWPTKSDFSFSDGLQNYIEDIKYNDNYGKGKVNLPDIEQEPKYTLKYYKDNKYNIQIKYYNQK